MLINFANEISIAFTLKNLGEWASELGSILFHKGVMGARVIPI